MMALGENRDRIDVRVFEGLNELAGVELGPDIGNERAGCENRGESGDREFAKAIS